MKKQIKISGLYVIVDPSMCKTNSILENTDAILSGGANIIQYRDKNSPIKNKYKSAKRLKIYAYNMKLFLLLMITLN